MSQFQTQECDVFCAMGMPYVSSKYNGDSYFAGRFKIKKFFSPIGDVKSVFVDGSFVRVVVCNITPLGLRLKEHMDNSVTDTISVSWETTPLSPILEEKELRSYRATMWHSSPRLPEKARSQHLMELGNEGQTRLEELDFQDELDLFDEERLMHEAIAYSKGDDSESDVESFINEAIEDDYNKRNLIVVVEAKETKYDYIETGEKTYTRDEVLEMMALMKAMTGQRSFTGKEVGKFL